MAKIKVRARTVDMLGRQQIAGIPTAISELFKNAHDAYAKNVVVDYYEYDDLFVLRDDGLGMSKDEFESNWLTLGTESKLTESSSSNSSLVDPDQKKRAILGEKGIGRLAVAALGSQVLILTRAKNISGIRRSRKLVAAFINWDIFALPHIDLSDIEIPIFEFEGNTKPNATDIQSMVSEAVQNLRNISSHNDSIVIEDIICSMEAFDIDPQECESFLPEGPSLFSSKSHGTHFFIRPVDSIIKKDLAIDDDTSSSLVKMLIGFTNSMTTSQKKLPLITKFHHHAKDGVVDDLIGPSEFFTTKEAENADHHFIGSFDKFGRFKGSVRIFNQAPVDFELNWRNPEQKETRCGPFSINFAYMQGHASESLLPQDEFTLINAKLKRIGGIYIYRDGVRILPYGDSDYDFLDIEKRRTKGAGYYFFSYRRIFGAIELSRKNNRGLVEKAGREGFRENLAYREFKSILENFFVQLAADYFRKGGENTEVYEALKSELKEKEKIKKERDKYSKRERDIFARQLDSFFLQLEKSNPLSMIKEFEDSFSAEIAKCSRKRTGQRKDVGQLLKDAHEELTKIKSYLKVSKPSGIGLSKELLHEYKSYETEWKRLEEDVFIPAERRIESQLYKILDLKDNPSSKKEIILLSLEGRMNEVKEETNHLVSNIENQYESLRARIQDQLITHLNRTTDLLDKIWDEASLQEFNTLSESDVEELQTKWDVLFRNNIEPEIHSIRDIVIDLRSLYLPNHPSSTELTEALEEEIVELKESQASQFELIQLGMALGVIHHEFRGCVRALRNSLRTLKRWSNKNPNLSDLYSNIRTNFDHLDGYLTLFTPLTRRLNRKKIEITGNEINKYLQDLFAQRFEQYKIELVASLAFKKLTLFEYPSSIFPCFVNLIDNSCFWLQDRRDDRKIFIDLDGEDICVFDTGPGIQKRDIERVFEIGFTRKPSGQGMGLYVCKETLKRIGYEITLDPPQRGKGVVFRIRHRDKN